MTDGDQGRPVEGRSGAQGTGTGSRDRGHGADGSSASRSFAKGTTTAAEWVVAGLSALLVLAALGFLFYEAMTSSSTPPIIELQVDTILATDYGYVVEFHARNHGQSTAAELTIEGSLLDAGRPVQTSQATIDYLPGESRRTAGLIFTEDPGRYTLVLRPVGYDRP